MQTPSTTSIWLSEQVGPLAVIVALLAVVLIILLWSAHKRRASMNAARSGLTEDTFVRSLMAYGFDPAIARTTFRYLQGKQGVSFPIESSDKLDEDLGLDLQDVDESVVDLLKLCERVSQPGLGHGPLITLRIWCV